MNKEIYDFAKHYFNIYRSSKATNFQVDLKWIAAILLLKSILTHLKM